MGHLAQPGRHFWTSCPVLISQPPGAKHGYKAQPTTCVHWHPFPFGSSSSGGPACFLLTPVLNCPTSLVLHWFLRVETCYHLSSGSRHVDMHETQYLLIQGLSPHRIFQCGKSSYKQERKAKS